MEELLYELKATENIRKAIAQTYNDKKDVDILIECYNIIDNIQEKIISNLLKKQDKGLI